MEYVVGPLLALLIGMKFTAYKAKQVDKSIDTKYEVVLNKVDEKIVASNTMISQQTVKLLTPVASSITKINNQLGLWTLGRPSLLRLEAGLLLI